jgi:hypothetical protein
MFDKTDKPAGRFLYRLLMVTEHNKIRRHRTLDLLVNSGSFQPQWNDFYRAEKCDPILIRKSLIEFKMKIDPRFFRNDFWSGSRSRFKK